MKDDYLNLFDFGTNENGDYVNLVEEEKRKNDISEKEFFEWLKKNNDPLIRIAFDLYISATEIEFGNHKDIQNKLLEIAQTKCYHYGNMEKGLYIFSLNNKGRHMLIFENENHYLGFEPSCYSTMPNGELKEIDFDDYLLGKETIDFPALYCPCYDLDGNRIQKYCDNPYQNDIRHIVCIKEWHMDKFSENRMQKGKKIKDFYEVEFALRDLMNYWGESEIENEDRES